MNGDDKKFAETLENILTNARLREPVRYALAQLFPKAEAALRTYVPRNSGDRNERKRQRRLSEKDFAPAYFRLDPQPASWSRSEIDAIINSLNPVEALNEVESRVNSAPEGDRSRLRRLFLEALDGVFGILRPFSVAWFKTLIDFGPSYIAARDETTLFLYAFDNADRLRWIIIHALEALLPEARAQLMMAVIPEVDDISILCDVFRTIVKDVHEQGAKSERQAASFGESTDTIREDLLARVRTLADRNQIWSQSQPDHILWFWWGCNFEVEVYGFTKKAMQGEEGLRGLLNVTVSLVRSTDGNYEHVNSSTWSKIVDLNELAERAKALKSSTNEADRLLAERFLNALEKGRQDPI
jgi:hypothetical protein